MFAFDASNLHRKVTTEDRSSKAVAPEWQTSLDGDDLTKSPETSAHSWPSQADKPTLKNSWPHGFLALWLQTGVFGCPSTYKE